MKRTVLVVIILFSALLLFAEYEDRVPCTATIDSLTLYSIRNSCNSGYIGYSPIMWQYWHDYLNSNSDEGEDLTEDGDREVFSTDHYVKEAFWGAIGHDVDEHSGDINTPDDILELASLHLLDPDFSITHPGESYLSLDEVFYYFQGNGQPGNYTFRGCLDLGYILENMAFMVDMLWEYNENLQGALTAKLDSVASYVDSLLYASGENGTVGTGNPWIGNYNGRIRLAGALGYAGCVLDSTSYINHAKDELFTYVHSASAETHPGFIGLHLANSNVYSEGLAYTNYAFDGVTLFFTALKRQTDENLYDYPYMKAIFENSLNYIAPDFGVITIDDSYKQNSYTYELFIHYLYQSDTISSEVLDNMKWYAQKYKSEDISGSSKYPGSYNRYKYVLDFNPASDRDIDSYFNILPQNLIDGNYSDEELTILRQSASDVDDFVNNPTLIVTHENTVSCNHEHADESSFQLYFDGIQLLIDPGYGPSYSCYKIAKDWLESPYAHNLIMVNPDTLRENHELNQDYYNVNSWTVDSLNTYWDDFCPHDYYEPIGDHGYFFYNNQGPTYSLETPCYKNYLIINNNIDHLQIEIEYDHPQEYYELNGNPLNNNDVIDIFRNFYSINWEYFIIYDDVFSSDSTASNEFMNQLHFGSIMLPKIRTVV